MTKARIIQFILGVSIAFAAFTGSRLYSHEGRIAAVEVKAKLDHEMLSEIRSDIKTLLRER